MKVMIRRVNEKLSAYVPKKDLEEPVIDVERESLWGGWIRLRNGWLLELPIMDPETTLPVTVNARLIGEKGD